MTFIYHFFSRQVVWEWMDRFSLETSLLQGNNQHFHRHFSFPFVPPTRLNLFSSWLSHMESLLFTGCAWTEKEWNESQWWYPSISLFLLGLNDHGSLYRSFFLLLFTDPLGANVQRVEKRKEVSLVSSILQIELSDEREIETMGKRRDMNGMECPYWIIPLFIAPWGIQQKDVYDT